MSETLTGQTTRSILFGAYNDPTGARSRRLPAGTTVYVTETRKGKFIARIPGTLLEQQISLIDVEPF